MPKLDGRKLEESVEEDRKETVGASSSSDSQGGKRPLEREGDNSMEVSQLLYTHLLFHGIVSDTENIFAFPWNCLSY